MLILKAHRIHRYLRSLGEKIRYHAFDSLRAFILGESIPKYQ